MAGYRQFHTKFWKDGWVIELTPVERYLFAYLFTNEQSSISGIYELPMKVIENETGLDRDFLKTALQKFQDAKKIFYKDSIMWVVKMRVHHQNASPLTMKKVNADIAWIPEGDVKNSYRYYQETGKYCIDTVSIGCLYPIVKAEAEDKTKDEAEAEKETPPLPVNIYQIYTKEIGVITPMVSDELKQAETDYTIEWITDAFKEAVDHNARNWKYVSTVLKAWKDKGKKGGNGKQSSEHKFAESY